MKEIDYEEIANAVARRLMSMPPPEKVIWDSKNCSSYLCISERHFIDKISKTHAFPTAIKLPSEKGKGHSRWLAHEVQAWVLKYKQKH